MASVSLDGLGRIFCLTHIFWQETIPQVEIIDDAMRNDREGSFVFVPGE